MVYLQGISHQFEIDVINGFFIKYLNQFGTFFKRSWFFALVSEKREAFHF